MSPSRITESIVEEAALAWLEGLGWRVAHGPGPCDLSACDACLRATHRQAQAGTGRHRQASHPIRWAPSETTPISVSLLSIGRT